MTDRFTMTVQALLGIPWPMPADLPGVVHECRDELLPEAERAEILAAPDITDAEAALLLQVTRQRVGQLRAELAQKAAH